MIALIILLIVGIIFFLLMSIYCDGDSSLMSMGLTGLTMSCFWLGWVIADIQSCEPNIQHDTELINKYKSGNYHIRVEIEEDKVDTLYIFK